MSETKVMNFKGIANAVARQFQKMVAQGTLFRIQVEADELWQTYLTSFPEGCNPFYKTRTEHDCGCCKTFIRTLGGVVAIKEGKRMTIWDDVSDADEGYQAVAFVMRRFVRANVIQNVFLHPEKSVGTAKSHELLEDQSVKTWDHFFVNLPNFAFEKKDKIGPRLAEGKASHDVLFRSLQELTVDSVDTVLELIAQNSFYRGEENKFTLGFFRNLLVQSKTYKSAAELDNFAWGWSQRADSSVCRIRNTSIGTLLLDLSEGKDLDESVKAFESKVAPTNYKRPTAIVTKAMVQKAQQKIRELGFESALERRYATIEDITINNILFADRAARKEMTNAFDELIASTPQPTKSFDKIEEIGIEAFISDILPKSKSIEVLLENKHAGNLMSLIAPVDPTAINMFKWPNNFSWSYSGDVADSIKEKVKRAGGQIVADLRCSLSWFNHDDLDLHLTEPGGNEIYYSNKVSPTGGMLDVDMNAGSGTTRSPVENIFFPNKKKMTPGIYTLRVNNFAARETKDVGFEAEIEFEGQVYSFSYSQPVRNRSFVEVAMFSFDQKNGFKILRSLPNSQTSKQIWGLTTQTFHRAKVVMLSPNFWDEKNVGNKHYFFMLDGCKNEDKARGFYNEFLNANLSEHRKVLELVGSKMKTEESEQQLSGLGFSSTQRNSIVVRVTGNFTRIVKVIF